MGGEIKESKVLSSRMTIWLSKELEQMIVDLRKTDRFCRCSLSEVARELLERGLKELEEE